MEKSLETPLLAPSLPSGADRPAVYKPFSTPKQYLLTAFRSLHLHVLPQLTKWRHMQEPKKTAIYRSRKAAILHALVHIVPFTVGSLLVVFNIKTLSIGDMSPTGLMALQFVSKLLEVLMQASIAAIVLGFIRLQVLGMNEFPFGGLIAPFRTAEIASLWSLELWGCLTSNSVDTTTRLFLCLLLPTAVILASLVGPSSAVLMIPRPVSSLRNHDLYLYDQMETLYPLSVNLQPNQTLIAEPLFNKTYYDVLTNFSKTEFQPYWGTVIDKLGVRNLEFKTWTDGTDLQINGSGLATVPVVLCLEDISSTGADSMTIAAQQPFVLIDCWSSSELIDNTERTDRYVDFGPNKSFLKGAFSFDTLTSNLVNTTAESNLTDANDDAKATFHFSQDSYDYGYFNPSNVSIAWSLPPSGVTNISLVMAMGTISLPYNNWSVSACSVESYWAAARANADTASILRNELPDGDDDSPNTKVSHLHNRELIALSPAWAKRNFLISADFGNSLHSDFADSWLRQAAAYALSLSYISSQRRLDPNNSIVNLDSTTGSSQNYAPLTDQQYKALVDYLELKTRRPNNDGLFITVNGVEWTDPAKLARVEKEFYQNRGYVYEASTITVRLSLAVVIFYLLATAGYLLLTVITGNVANSWTSVAELVTLALNSQKSTDLKNISVGIDTLETFRRPVNIRVSEDESLELVFNAAGLR